jgi:D-alanyl-lipoteichoic acid acyltransferase DltB (MBOAT superfamily)
MEFSSLAFVGLSLTAVALLRLLQSRSQREVALLTVNIIFVASFARGTRELFPTICFLAFGYLAICAAAWRARLLGILIVAVVGTFIWLKQYTIISSVPRLSFLYSTVGLSYILFGILHLMVDVSQKETATPSVLRYINYTTFFLTFVSGPIQRWQDHDAQLQSPPVEAGNLQLERGLGRAALGYVYIILFDRLAAREDSFFYDHFNLHVTAHSWLLAASFLAVTASLFLLHLYLNFAGYMHVVIGIGVLAGLRLPENFNDPFRTANFVELWSRWHITLSEWFKFYLFNPLLKAMGRRWGDAVPMAYLGAISFFITFSVMGIWHGTTGYFLVFGLLLGLGVSVNRLWQIVAAKWLGRDKYRLLCERTIYADSSRSAAIAFFSMSLTCLWLDDGITRTLLSPMGMLCCVLGFVIIAAAGMVVIAGERALMRTLQPFLVRWIDRYDLQANELGARWIAIAVWAVVLLTFIRNGAAPDFVYQGF